MKYLFRIIIPGILIFSAVFYSCKKERIPVLKTSTVTGITGTTAVSGGTITDQGSAKISDRGICWSTVKEPTIAYNKISQTDDIDTFTCNITGLLPAETYYVRSYATNKAGTGYGDIMSFTTLLSDADGNLYTPVTIGTQIWMVENLRTTKFNDGTAVPLVTTHSSWSTLTTPGYSWYNNDASANKEIYGALYNWYSVNTGKLCPSGWHIPSDIEWETLSVYLTLSGYGSGGSGNDIAKAMASKSTWLVSTEAASIGNDLSKNNRSGLNALPGGIFIEGQYFSLGQAGNWWSSTKYDNTSSYSVQLNYNVPVLDDEMIFKNYCGLSVRCLKD